MFQQNRRAITEFVKQAYLAYVGVKLGDQDKTWAPRLVCKTCTEQLRQWTTSKRKCLKFGVPMVWREPKNHVDDCYFCLANINGINRNNRHQWTYPNLDSAIRPIPHSDEIPIPTFHELPDISDNEHCPSDRSSHTNETNSDDEWTSSVPQRFNQNELNDLTRDLNLSKKAAEVLASRLKEKNLLEQGTKITFYRTREKDLLPFFSQEDNLVFCHEIRGLMKEMGLSAYIPDEWRLFIDSSKRSLKCVLLHNGNKYGSIPIAHSTKLKEEYNTIGLVLQKIKYHEHQWLICVDLKMVNFLLGQQSGYTKYPCFLCLWDSRDKTHHWLRKDWPLRENMDVGEKNVIKDALVEREKSFFLRYT
nr:unnamed protein product [Callosobruchus analis]